MLGMEIPLAHVLISLGVGGVVFMAGLVVGYFTACRDQEAREQGKQ